MRILIIDSDKELSSKIDDKLKDLGYQCDIVENADDGNYFLDIRNYNLILIDFDILKINSLDYLTNIKTIYTKSSVIVLSNTQGKEDEINVLMAGADDYIRKPIDLDILQIRIEVKLRFGASNIIEINELIISPEEEKIIYNGKDIELKGKPFEVLTHLAMHKDQIVSKEQLLDAIWEEPELVTPNVIEVAINQIRQKMDKPLNITTIETVRRRGYRFCFPNKIS